VHGIATEVELRINELAKDGWKVVPGVGLYMATITVILQRGVDLRKL
jgi:hypothetical protein